MNGNSFFSQKHTIRIIAAIFIGAIICVALLLYQKKTIPRWVVWQNRDFTADTENGTFHFVLKDKQLQVFCDNKVVWESPEEYRVQDALLTNVIPDEKADIAAKESREELILLLWKKGRYGIHKPFWISEEESTWSQHLFVYTFREEALTSRWGSSYLGDGIREITSRDDWLFMKTCKNETQCYRWDSWGFTRMGEVKIAAVGDNLIHSQIYQYALTYGNGFDSVYEPVSEKIKEADLAVINQETPLVEDPSLYGDYPNFGTPAEVADAVAKAGFNLAVLATNHALDRGMSGIDTTIARFEKNDVICVGTIDSNMTSMAASAYKEQQKTDPDISPYRKVYKNGLTLGILNYTYGTNGKRLPEENPHAVCLLSDEEQIKKDIAAVRANTDAVLVFVHWGTENSAEIDEEQQYWRDIFYDCGVTAVIGSHPHVLQSYEMYTKEGSSHKMLVYYSLGNFVSAQAEAECTKGGLAEFCIQKTPDGCEIISYDLIKLVITYDKGNVQVMPSTTDK